MQWADIEGYPGYQVSDSGLLRSLDAISEQKNRWGTVSTFKRKGRLLKPQTMPNGYVVFQMRRGGKAELLHRLVATAFIPGDRSLQVNHKNGLRGDNRAENLEWLSCSDNHRHSYAHLKRKKHAKTTPTLLSKHGENVVFESELAAAQHLGVCAGSIHSAIHRGHLCRGYEVSHVCA